LKKNWYIIIIKLDNSAGFLGDPMDTSVFSGFLGDPMDTSGFSGFLDGPMDAAEFSHDAADDVAFLGSLAKKPQKT